MARVRPQPLLLISILDPTTQEGLVRGALVLNQLNKTAITVCTAIANQNDIEVDNITWLSFEEIKRQLDAIGRRYWIDWAVLCGISDLNLTAAIVDHLHRSRPGINIVWEPSLDTDDQKTPFNLQEQTTFWSLCKNVFLPVIPHKLLHTPFKGYTEEEWFAKLSAQNQVITTSHEELLPHRLYGGNTNNLYGGNTNNKPTLFYIKKNTLNPSTVFLVSLAALLYEGLEIEDACRQAFDFWESYPIN